MVGGKIGSEVMQQRDYKDLRRQYKAIALGDYIYYEGDFSLIKDWTIDYNIRYTVGSSRGLSLPEASCRLESTILYNGMYMYKATIVSKVGASLLLLLLFP